MDAMERARRALHEAHGWGHCDRCARGIAAAITDAVAEARAALLSDAAVEAAAHAADYVLSDSIESDRFPCAEDLDEMARAALRAALRATEPKAVDRG